MSRIGSEASGMSCLDGWRVRFAIFKFGVGASCAIDDLGAENICQTAA